jgi:hypothetical protein
MRLPDSMIRCGWVFCEALYFWVNSGHIDGQVP